MLQGRYFTDVLGQPVNFELQFEVDCNKKTKRKAKEAGGCTKGEIPIAWASFFKED